MIALRLLFVGLLLGFLAEGAIAMPQMHSKHRIALIHASQTAADHTGRHRHEEPGDAVQSAMPMICTMDLCHPEFLTTNNRTAPRAAAERHLHKADPLTSGVVMDVLKPPPKGAL